MGEGAGGAARRPRTINALGAAITIQTFVRRQLPRRRAARLAGAPQRGGAAAGSGKLAAGGTGVWMDGGGAAGERGADADAGALSGAGAAEPARPAPIRPQRSGELMLQRPVDELLAWKRQARPAPAAAESVPRPSRYRGPVGTAAQSAPSARAR